MTTQSIDLHQELRTAIAQAENVLVLRGLVEIEQQKDEIARRAGQVAETWAKPLARLRSVLPEWIHEYIEEPFKEYEEVDYDGYVSLREYRYVRIVVPGCNPIAAWIGEGKTGTVVFEVMQPKLDQDEDCNWYVKQTVWQERRNRHNIDSGETDIAVALFQAHDAYLKFEDLQHQAIERNCSQPDPDVLLVPAPEPEPEPADPIDQALELISRLSNSQQIKPGDASDDPEDLADDRTLVLAGVGIAIAHHLRRTADALERIQWSKQ